ncbi:DUF3784 domain-containing protein [Blautia sp. AF25-12LB]|nr:DUF3784 domain-containing protein [Blautia sp. AF25-12LB]
MNCKLLFLTKCEVIMMKDVIVELLIMAFFLLIGCLLFNGRGGCFIPIYNALSEKEQNSYNKKVLFKGVGICYLVCSMSVGLMIISKLFEVVWLPYISAIVIVISVVLLNIWMCLSKNIRNYK